MILTALHILSSESANLFDFDFGITNGWPAPCRLAL